MFQPMGFDAFGIHSENYALKVGVNPNDLIPRNIDNFTRMLRRFGGMFDWNHTVDTTNPNYYRWTQWVFLKLHEAGLVEVRYRGLAKNKQRIALLLGFANLLIAGRHAPRPSS